MILYLTISYYIISNHIILYHWSHHVILYHITSNHTTSLIISYDITTNNIVSYHIILYHITSIDMFPTWSLSSVTFSFLFYLLHNFKFLVWMYKCIFFIYRPIEIYYVIHLFTIFYPLQPLSLSISGFKYRLITTIWEYIREK